MVRELRGQSRRRAALTGLPALVRISGTPAVVVKRNVHGRGGCQIVELLREAVRQPVEPLHKEAGRAVEPFDMRGAYRPFVYPAADCPPFGADHFGRVVLHVGVLVLLYDDAVLAVGAERQVNRFRIVCETVRGKLDLVQAVGYALA